MRDYKYNRITQNITNGLDRVKVGSGGDRVQLVNAPANANVKVSLNARDNDLIDLEVNHSVLGVHNELYVSCDAVSSETIEIIQSSGDFKIETPVSDVNVEEIADFSDALLAKIVPYELPELTLGGGNYSSATTMISKTLSCDKIQIDLSVHHSSYGGYLYEIEIIAFLDNVAIARIGHYDPYGSSSKYDPIFKPIAEIEDVKGKDLLIKMRSSSSGIYGNFALQEFTKRN